MHSGVYESALWISAVAFHGRHSGHPCEGYHPQRSVIPEAAPGRVSQNPQLRNWGFSAEYFIKRKSVPRPSSVAWAATTTRLCSTATSMAEPKDLMGIFSGVKKTSLTRGFPEWSAAAWLTQPGWRCPDQRFGFYHLMGPDEVVIAAKQLKMILKALLLSRPPDRPH